MIEAVGKQEALDLANGITGERGRLMIAGYHQDGPRRVTMRLWNWRGVDVINAHERDPRTYVRGMRESCSWRLQAGRDAEIGASFYGTEGGVSFRNVQDSFYHFTAERYEGTACHTLETPPDDWGARAA